MTKAGPRPSLSASNVRRRAPRVFLGAACMVAMACGARTSVLPELFGASDLDGGEEGAPDAPVESRVNDVVDRERTSSDVPTDVTVPLSGAWVIGYYSSWDDATNGGSFSVAE